MKSFLKNILPYFVVKVIIPKLRTRNRLSNNWSGDYVLWSEATKNAIGYDEKSILEKVVVSTKLVMSGQKAFERDSVAFDHIEYSLPLLSGLLLAASMNKGEINVLDFGGALGSSFFQNIKFLKELTSVKWSIVEQKSFNDIGSELLKSNIQFYSSIDSCYKENGVNTVLLSSVLQYIDDPYAILDLITSKRPSIIILDRVSIINRSSDRITIQQVPKSIYEASYPCRFFNEDNILKNFSNYILIEKFESHITNEIIFSNGDKSKDFGYVFKLK